MNNPLNLEEEVRRKRRKERREGDLAWMTANERFKRDYSSWTWVGVLLATFLHFALFNWFPQLQAADMGSVTEDVVRNTSVPVLLVRPRHDE